MTDSVRHVPLSAGQELRISTYTSPGLNDVVFLGFGPASINLSPDQAEKLAAALLDAAGVVRAASVSGRGYRVIAAGLTNEEIAHRARIDALAPELYAALRAMVEYGWGDCAERDKEILRARRPYDPIIRAEQLLKRIDGGAS